MLAQAGGPFRLTDDEKRLRVQAYTLVLPARDSQDVERAIAELRFVGIWPRDLRLSLLDRLVAYRYAVARLWIETPSERLRIAEAAVAKLEARIGEPAVIAWSEPVPLAAGPVIDIIPRPVPLVSK